MIMWMVLSCLFTNVDGVEEYEWFLGGEKRVSSPPQ